ncbi:MAG: hypothetical protein Q7T80_11565 [Methanoregula sp.]|nr:hypothetical protein [Methanoregula sp.]
MANHRNMKQLIKYTAGLGTVLWLIGYLASLVRFFSPYAGVMGWILIAFFTPVNIVIVWWWFRERERLPLQYYASVGVAWLLIAIALDYLFIVLLFQANYYGIDVFMYYTATFLIPVGIGLFLNRGRNEPVGIPG